MYLSFSAFFSRVQEAPWYRSFLSPVSDRVSPGQAVLDIGTGSGKLLQWLALEKQATVTGLDTHAGMLREARRKLEGLPATLLHITPGEDYPLPEASFDVICICNVLFNMNEREGKRILEQCRRLLKPAGRILVLTPTGSGTRRDRWSIFLRPGNATFGLWYRLTRRRGQWWTNHTYLEPFAHRHEMTYERQLVFRGLAQLEILASPARE